MTDALHKRASRVRAQVIVQRWELRQQSHAKGVWFRLRRLLAGSDKVFSISDADMEALLTQERLPHPVGLELHPQRIIVAVTPEELSSLPSAREHRVALCAELLAARNWVVVPFDAPVAPKG
jgi:hypothetical protein